MVVELQLIWEELQQSKIAPLLLILPLGAGADGFVIAMKVWKLTGAKETSWEVIRRVSNRKEGQG